MDHEDLNIDLGMEPHAPRTRGRAAKPLEAETLRDLTPADIKALATAPRAASKAVPLKALRQRHHTIARLLAIGTRPGDVASITGYDPSRISILQADPQFRDLVEHYATGEDHKLADLKDRMSTLSLDALEELTERLDTAPESFSEALLLEISTRMADRVGHSPKGGGNAGNTEVHVHLGERMSRARERIEALRAAEPAKLGPVIDG